MKKITFVIYCLLALLNKTLSQNVGINTDGSLPDAKAMLDIKSSNKGVLFPRTSTNTRRSIISPAQGLIMFDTTTNSLWHFNGTNWAEQTDSINYIWKKSGSIYYVPDGIRVGINISPINTLHLHDINASQLRLTNTATGTTGLDGFVIGVNSGGLFNIENKETGRNVSFSTNGGFNQHLLVTASGEVGFNNAVNPPSDLSIKGGIGQKIIFNNNNASQGFGIGVQNNALQIHIPDISSTIDIGYGRSGANFKRIMQIKGNGEVDINGKLTRPIRTGGTDLLPIAFGKVFSNGVPSGAAGNWSATKIGEGEFELNFPDENLAGEPNRYMIQVSPYIQLSGDYLPGVSFSTEIVDGKYIIRMGSFEVESQTNPNCDIGSAECSYLPHFPRNEPRKKGFGFVLFKL